MDAGHRHVELEPGSWRRCENGVSASEQFKPVATGDTATIDTSELDNGCEWVLRVYAGVVATSPEQNCNSAESDYCVTICSPNGASGDTVPEGAQELFLAFTDGGSTTIEFQEGYNAPGSTLALGEYTAGDELILTLSGYGDTDTDTSNTPVVKGLTALSVSSTGDVAINTDLTPTTATGLSTLNIADDIVFDISAPGSYSASITVESNDNGYPSYTVNFTWTAV